ncbi:hypothetical protein BDP81DRAFT_438937 [Colletotrichum phormii]|uniref:Uncharacterized protein n=1 Tax=Colletotrichum phormii TaxID=359342 RepID=A0AAI9ZFZ2_9PEZI|nr:uncharacterized protein BDP81DRAFT_438937 [Colletotrichum phormii]KAK1623858.1 hypothetical protein BDP81DRAFT_438937 [Colletotrichum phormii]
MKTQTLIEVQSSLDSARDVGCLAKKRCLPVACQPHRPLIFDRCSRLFDATQS